MRRTVIRLAWAVALAVTGFAIGAELGWQELPSDVKAELGGY
jgi:hypothetical protein